MYIYFFSQRKRRKRPLSPDDLEREILAELKRDAPQERDEDDLFGLSVGASLKKMTPQQKALAKVQIQKVMFEIQYCI